MSSEAATGAAPDLLLFRGGLLNDVFRRTGWASPQFPSRWGRFVAILTITLVPLVVLSIVEGTLVGPPGTLPLLRDVATLVRFLLALPLLLLAESAADRGTRDMVRHCREGDVLQSDAAGRFESHVASVNRPVLSIVPELVFLAMAFLLIGTFHADVPAGIITWYHRGTGPEHSVAGNWYRFVSLPLYRFMLLTWLWRYGTWVWFLVRLSRLRLNVRASHPDGAGGLNFLALSQRMFSVLLLALSTQAAGHVAGTVLYQGRTMTFWYQAIGGYVLVELVLVLGPLCVFGPLLFEGRRKGLRTFSTLARSYTSQFERKWIEQRGGKEGLLGTPDLQSLADLGNSFSIVRNMRIVPFSRKDVVTLLGAAIVPFLPLLLFVYPFDELLKMLVKLVL